MKSGHTISLCPESSENIPILLQEADLHFSKNLIEGGSESVKILTKCLKLINFFSVISMFLFKLL